MQPLPLSEALPPGIEVFRLELDLAAPLADADWSLLSEDEGVRALRFHQHADRVRFVSARAALRRLLGARLQRKPQALRFVANRHGKPRLAGACSADPAIHFNVSHAGDFALIAVSARDAVGVDIERRDPDLDTAYLVPHALSPLEQQMPSAQRVDFFECWAVKEAVLKSLGLGVAEHLQQLTVLAPEPGDGRRYRLRHDVADWPVVGARRLDSPPGYATALAWHVGATREST